MRPKPRPLLGNRAFWALIATAAMVRTALAVSLCCVAVVLADRVARHGVRTLWGGAPSALPATVAVVVVAAGLLAGVVAAVRVLRATVAFRRRIVDTRVDVPAALSCASRRLGMAGEVTVVDDRQPFALTYGLFQARVLVSSGLLDRINPAELGAVLVHEREHVRSRDPLKTAVARVLAGRYFFLPLLRHLAERYTDGRELAADRRAVDAYGVPAVAGALLKVVETPRWGAAASAAAMGAARLLDVRIGQLETGAAASPGKLGVLRLSAGIAGFAVLAWALAGTAALMAHATLVDCILAPGN